MVNYLRGKKNDRAKMEQVQRGAIRSTTSLEKPLYNAQLKRREKLTCEQMNKWRQNRT